MFELSLVNVKKYMESTLVLNNINFQVYSGEKVGIVGVNGSGKSTILKLIAGILPMDYCVGYPGATSPGYDEGFINMPTGATCAYLEQIPQYEDKVKVIDVLKMAFDEVYKIEEKMHKLEEEMQSLKGEELDKALKQYSNLVENYEVKDGYNTEEKLSKICTGLKFTESFLDKEFNLLSGGEKTTVILGKLLMDNPDILLLDEPTNHLDIESIETFEEALEEFKGTIFFISHDRYFINKIAERVIAIEDYKFKSYLGNYDYYKEIQDKLKLEKGNNIIQKEKDTKNEKKKKEIDESKKREIEIKKLETKIQKLESELKEVELAMEDTEIHYEDLNELFSRKEELSLELENVMEEWMKISI